MLQLWVAVVGGAIVSIAPTGLPVSGRVNIQTNLPILGGYSPSLIMD